VHPLRSVLSDCFFQVLGFFWTPDIIPDYMSSDAGLNHKFCLIWSSMQSCWRLNNCNDCVMVETSAFLPTVVLPAAAIIIYGIEIILFINSFLGELIGGLEMTCLCAIFLTLIEETWAASR
jgi:hypothetical protein